MHRALQIQEIQANIIDLVAYFEHNIYELHAEQKEFRKARRDLCAVALTCKALLPYALECRWRVIRSLAELLRTLPAEIWTTHQRHDPQTRQVTTVFTLREPIKEEHLSRFNWYAAQVRTLIQPIKWLRVPGKWDKSTWPELEEYDSSALFELVLVCGGKLILPRLEAFHVNIALEDYKFHDILPLLLPASLKSLCIETYMHTTNRAELHQFLQALKLSCQNILHLRVASSPDNDTIANNPYSLTDFLPMQELYRLPHLKSFGSHWGFLSPFQFMIPEKILNIAPCCNVTTLNLRFCDAHSDVLKHYSGPFFSHLEHLTLEADGLQGAREFLRCLSSRSLKGLHINYRYFEDPEFSDFVVVARQYLNPESLLHFDVRCQPGRSLPFRRIKVSTQNLLPLFAFKNLESLVIILNQDFGQLDDVHFEQICNAFPQLRILDMAGFERTTSMSTTGVMSALQRLPYLEFFGLRFKMDPPPDNAVDEALPSYLHNSSAPSNGLWNTDIEIES